MKRPPPQNLMAQVGTKSLCLIISNDHLIKQLSSLVFFPFLKHNSHSNAKRFPVVFSSFKLFPPWSLVHYNQDFIQMPSSQLAVLAHISNQYSGTKAAESGAGGQPGIFAISCSKERKTFRETFLHQPSITEPPLFLAC